MTSDAADEATARPVPAAFIADPSAPTGTRFQCTACGWEACARVTVKKPTGDHYRTEFVSCGACRAMFHWIGEVPIAARPLLPPAPAPGAPNFGTYMAGPSGPHEGVSEERIREIQEAAERARKGRSWRAKKR